MRVYLHCALGARSVAITSAPAAPASATSTSTVAASATAATTAATVSASANYSQCTGGGLGPLLTLEAGFMVASRVLASIFSARVPLV